MKRKTKFKQTEIGDWEEAVFSEAIEVNPKRELKKGQTAKFVSMADIEPFKRKISNFITKEFKSGSKFQNKDILFARITPCLENGKTAFIDFLKDNEIGFGSTEFIILSSKKEKTDPYFVYYLSRTPEVRKIAIKSMTGTSGRQRVENEVFDTILINLPSIQEQQSIAKILSDLDSKIELNNKMNKTLEAIGQAIFKHWFIDFEFPNEKGKPYKSSGGEMINSELGKIPKGWKVSKIGDEFETILGGTPSTTNKSYWENGTIPWINSGAINDFPIINASQHITEAGLNNSATQLMPKKTVVLPFVISINKDIRISITGIETSGNQSVLGIVENEKIPCEFIYYWVEKMKDDIYSWVTGGAQQHINKNNVDNTLILIPNNNVMNNFKKLLIPIFDKILNNSYETKNLSQIRDSLLPKLMSGKIRVK